MTSLSSCFCCPSGLRGRGREGDGFVWDLGLSGTSIRGHIKTFLFSNWSLRESCKQIQPSVVLLKQWTCLRHVGRQEAPGSCNRVAYVEGEEGQGWLTRPLHLRLCPCSSSLESWLVRGSTFGKENTGVKKANLTWKHVAHSLFNPGWIHQVQQWHRTQYCKWYACYNICTTVSKKTRNLRAFSPQKVFTFVFLQFYTMYFFASVMLVSKAQ